MDDLRSFWLPAPSDLETLRFFQRHSTDQPPPWIFAEEIKSAATFAECERLAALGRDSVVLELGTYLGRSTVALASTASVVHSVDPHRGGPGHRSDSLTALIDNLVEHRLRDKVVVHVGLSTQVVPLLQEAAFDLVFVDAMHQRPDVDIDLALAARCLRPGGCLAFHDYGVEGVWADDAWHQFGVTQAVDEFVESAGVDPAEVVETLAVVRSPLPGAGERQRWDAAVARQRAVYAV